MISATETDVMVRQDHILQGDPAIAHKYAKSQEGTITCPWQSRTVETRRDLGIMTADSGGQRPACMLWVSETGVNVEPGVRVTYREACELLIVRIPPCDQSCRSVEQ